MADCPLRMFFASLPLPCIAVCWHLLSTPGSYIMNSSGSNRKGILFKFSVIIGIAKKLYNLSPGDVIEISGIKILKKSEIK